MQQFTLKQLEYFRAVADAGSFSSAAEALYISQSAVAAAMTELERAVDAQLLVRKKAQGIKLTPVGTRFLDEARTLLRAASELQLSTSGRPDQLAGPVSLGCIPTLAATVLPRLIDGFGTEHPDVTISFVDGTMPELVPLLENGLLDMLITYRIALPPGLDDVVLYDTEVHVLLSASHRLAAAETVSLAELADEPLIMFDQPPSGRHTLDLLQAAGIQPNIAHRTTNFELVRSMVARGLGYTLLVQKPQIEHSYEGLPLVAKRIAPEFSKEQAIIVWPRAVKLTPRARAVIDYARETVAANVWTPVTEAATTSTGRENRDHAEDR